MANNCASSSGLAACFSSIPAKRAPFKYRLFFGLLLKILLLAGERHFYFLPFLLKIGIQLSHLRSSLNINLLMQRDKSCFFFLLPQFLAIFIKATLFFRLLLHSFCIGKRLINKLLPFRNGLQQRLVKKALQNPDQNQEIEDFKDKSG